MLECIRHVDGGWGIWTLTLAAARAQVYNEIFALGATYSFFICDALGSKDEAGEFRWLHGVPFKDVQAYFPKAVVAGVLQADNTVKMGADALVHTLSAGDKLILLASAYGQTRARRYARRAPSLLSKPVGKVGAQGAAGEAAAGKKGKGGVVVLGSNERSMTTLKEIAALVPGAAVSCEPKNYMNTAALEAAGVLKAQTVIVLSESNTASNVDYASDSELLGIVETLAALQWGDETEVSVCARVCVRDGEYLCLVSRLSERVSLCVFVCLCVDVRDAEG